MTFSLLFYRKNCKTYSGFGLWVLSTFTIAVAYVSVLLLGMMPELLGIIITNVAIVLAVVFRLDGTARFIQSEKIAKGFYLLPVLIIPIAGYFYLVNNDLAMRNLFYSMIVLIISCIIAFKLYKNSNPENRRLYLTGAALFFIYSLLISGRAIFWILNPQDGIFIAGKLHQFYFLGTLIFEIGAGIFFLMINNQRLETELLTARNNLQILVEKLEKSVSEVRSLSGIIPICMHCKGIRDDKGYWNKLEKFIAQHSEAKFSHGICDKCLEKYYPEAKE